MSRVRLRRPFSSEHRLAKTLNHIEGNEMAKNQHSSERQEANSLDHRHPRHHFLKRAHRDWRVWIVVALMLASMVVYVLSDNESLRPGRRTGQPMPAAAPPWDRGDCTYRRKAIQSALIHKKAQPHNNGLEPSDVNEPLPPELLR